MSKINRFPAILGLFCWAFLLGCNSEKKETNSTMVFYYNEAAGISSLDPIQARNQENIWAVDQLFSRLFRFNSDLKIEGDLAEKWVFENQEWTISIKKGVQWHSATPQLGTVLASDVAFSLERLRNPKNASAGAWVLDQVSEITVQDSLTLKIKVKEFHPAFLSLLAMSYCSVVPEKYVEIHGDKFGAFPIGSGPFQFFQWRRNSALVFHKNPNYYERDSTGASLPYLDAVVVKFVRDNMAVVREIQKGEMHMLSGLDGDLIRWVNKDSNLVLLKGPYLKTDYIGVNTESPKKALQSADFRKALNFALDKKRMIAFLKNGIGIPAHSSMVPDALSPISAGRVSSYNLDSAKFYLARVDTTWYQDTEFELATTAGYTQLCEWIQGQWQRIGIKIKVNVLPSSIHRQRVAEGQVDLFRKSWIADFPHPENFLMLYASGQKAPKGPNYTRFHSAEFDAEYSQLFNPIGQVDYIRMDQIVAQELPAIPLFYDQVTRCLSPKVQGLNINALNSLDLRKVKVLD
ncbi:MAG: ABC-type transport system substrate-binding protein [Luteibaculaceae bacterium]|jgi:ABC-type transport system substrate-binding protein